MGDPGIPPVLRRSDVDPDPIVQFGSWFEEALHAGLVEPTAASLATADASGKPSARMVLLKGFDADGFVFYTNYGSRKSDDLTVNPQAALTFWWDKLQRQIRIEGTTEKVTGEESDQYFASRPRGSRIGAHASHQSSELDSRADLQARIRELEEEFASGDIPRPAEWGGYRITPQVVELWQGRPSRLHDRIVYRQREDGEWTLHRLSP